MSHQLPVIEKVSCIVIHLAMDWLTSLLSLVTCLISLYSHLVLHCFSTAAACPGRDLLDILVGRCRRDALLLGLVLAAGSATAIAFALFLPLVMCTGASVSIGVATHAAAFRSNWTCRVDFNVS